MADQQYKQIAAAWKGSTDKGNYISITNTGDTDIVVKPGEKFFLNENNYNRTPGDRKPDYTKSVKVEAAQQTSF